MLNWHDLNTLLVFGRKKSYFSGTLLKWSVFVCRPIVLWFRWGHEIKGTKWPGVEFGMKSMPNNLSGDNNRLASQFVDVQFCMPVSWVD